MFNDIAPKYDFLNGLLSIGIDKLWRKAVIKKLKKKNPTNILDIATGTADLAILETRKISTCTVIGVDIAEQMLQIGNIKIVKHNLQNRIQLQIADGHNLPFDDNRFDATTIAFGLRNFENPIQGVTEMYRVIKPNGTTIILEFTKSKNRLFQALFALYFGKILPLLGKLISKHSSAYSYLPNSVTDFNDKFNISDIMKQEGFINVKSKPLTFGVATLFCGTKPSSTNNNVVKEQ